MTFLRSRWIVFVAIGALAVAGVMLWKSRNGDSLPEGFASANGRLEAVEIDIAAKAAGRLEDVLVREGELVTAGEPLAKMDTAVLFAQQREAEANLQRAEIAVETAQHLVRQQEAQRRAAEATVAQRNAELASTQKSFDRAKTLVARETAPVERLDNATAALDGAHAAVAAAQAQLAAAEAGVSHAKSQVVAARAGIDAAKATQERIEADIEDATLRSPRDGRVQYLVAQPAEVVAAGGVVLNMVDLTDVYMSFFLTTTDAGRVALGSDVHIVLDAASQYVIPATVSYVADVAQFTPKSVETAEERAKLMFRIKAAIPAALLEKYITYVKTGLPGMAYVQLDPAAEWPEHLVVRLPSE